MLGSHFVAVVSLGHPHPQAHLPRRHRDRLAVQRHGRLTQCLHQRDHLRCGNPAQLVVAHDALHLQVQRAADHARPVAGLHRGRGHGPAQRRLLTARDNDSVQPQPTLGPHQPITDGAVFVRRLTQVTARLGRPLQRDEPHHDVLADLLARRAVAHPVLVLGKDAHRPTQHRDRRRDRQHDLLAVVRLLMHVGRARQGHAARPDGPGCLLMQRVKDGSDAVQAHSKKGEG